MRDSEIADYVRSNSEAIQGSSPGYRCAATLNDGLVLPCVLISPVQARVSLALRRFEETRLDAALPESKRRWGNGMQYQDIVKNFVASGDRVNSYHIRALEKSRFAIPLARLKEVRGETRMSWTQFSAVMHDGNAFSFGTTFNMEFFEMPDGYSGDDIAQIVSHGSTGGHIYRDRPFFTCFIDKVD